MMSEFVIVDKGLLCNYLVGLQVCIKQAAASIGHDLGRTLSGSHTTDAYVICIRVVYMCVGDYVE